MRAPFMVDRQSEEPLGRWENRCDFISNIGLMGPDLVCDRPKGHKGMHSGRLVISREVVGYGRLRGTR